MNASRLLVACVLCLSAQILSAAEPDFAREARLAEQIVDAILDGDAEWLDAGGREFLSIYTEADEPGAAVMILHGRGYHPDWADVVNPLRIGLVEHGYATLSLQMPVLQKDATYYDYVPIFPYAYPRIEAGVRFLRAQGHDRVFLLAHSCGVHMAMAWIGQQDAPNIDAFIGLGMGATDYGQPMLQPFPFERLRVPVLDLYGADEFPAVLGQAPQRKAGIEQAGNPLSQQVVLAGANHYFSNYGDELLEAVAAWLDRLD